MLCHSYYFFFFWGGGWHLLQVAHCNLCKMLLMHLMALWCFPSLQTLSKWVDVAQTLYEECHFCCLSEVHAHWQFSCKVNSRGRTGAKFHALWVQTLLNVSLLTGWIACRCSSIHRVDLHIQTDYAKEEEERGQKSFGEQTFDFAFEGRYRKTKDDSTIIYFNYWNRFEIKQKWVIAGKI